MFAPFLLSHCFLIFLKLLYLSWRQLLLELLNRPRTLLSQSSKPEKDGVNGSARIGEINHHAYNERPTRQGISVYRRLKQACQSATAT